MAALSPYPGLRPFTEDESIFFKGREKQVESMSKRLEEKKFLMVNGASGDGKSSLVFAGLIPHAKAGFFKARYNQWLVADFKPERTPLNNLAESLSKKLRIQDVAKTKKELSFGFSALIDLYKNSSFYVDEESAEWRSADEIKRKEMRRRGANLIIVADQFEEFFTNPENYIDGNPGNESQQVVNILLETYRIAVDQQIPVYVVCTMRSDFIGQCAAFRGLPEAIGYSQFFVPRLNRREMEQVIEGPAELAGGKVSKRLSQILLNSIKERFDQLPILQHALSRMWKLADEGREALDLLHLAKAGGIKASMLTGNDREEFEKWFNALPDFKKQFYENPSILNILNAHANELLYFNIEPNILLKEIEKSPSVRYVKILFQSLTSLDKGRMVRRRASVAEILEIINDKDLDLEFFYQLLDIYRNDGNSFIRPYIKDKEEQLKSDSILDITHESLIRNWKVVEKWVYEEEENIQTWLEIEKPLKAWKAHKAGKTPVLLKPFLFFKMKKFLLPAGLYELYNTWQKNNMPHLAWLKRISPAYQSENLRDYQQFMKQSRNVIISNKIQPYIVFAVILFFVIQSQRAKINQAEQAITYQNIQKELVKKAELNEKIALKLKTEAERKEQEANAELQNLLRAANVNASADKMNILYIGPENPVTISVPGFKCEQLITTISKGKLKKTGECKYIVDFKNSKVKNNEVVEIFVSTLVKGKEVKLKNETPFVFRAKDVPEPKIEFTGKSTSDFYISEKDFLNSDLPKPVIPNFDFKTNLSIGSFFISILGQGKELNTHIYYPIKAAVFHEILADLIKNSKWEDAEIVTENPETGRITRTKVQRLTIAFEGADISISDEKNIIAPMLKFFVFRNTRNATP